MLFNGISQYAVFGCASDYKSVFGERRENPLSSGEFVVVDDNPPVQITANSIA